MIFNVLKKKTLTESTVRVVIYRCTIVVMGLFCGSCHFDVKIWFTCLNFNDRKRKVIHY